MSQREEARTAAEMFMVFDVESVGLHGEGFAVGAVVVRTEDGQELDSLLDTCPPVDADGLLSDLQWVCENVMPHLPHPSCFTPFGVRQKFWAFWEVWKQAGAVMAADVPWPVESNFLRMCIHNFGRENGPYPIIDVASVRLAKGLDPLAVVDRLPSELPRHNPLADARQSARLLLESLQRV